MDSKHVLLIAGAAALTAAGIVACGGSSSTPPTTLPPTTTTTTTRPTQNVPVCNPTPPPLYGIRVKVHDNGDGNRRILDSRPIVVDADGFCERAGFGSAHFCFTRREGDPDMAECDQAAMGISSTGRWGPNWFYEGRPCAGGSPGCSDNPNNQFMLVARGSGTFEACAADNIPLSQDPLYPGARCGGCTLREGSTDCAR